jgi:polar amino acid transport system ATP-binding protein
MIRHSGSDIAAIFQGAIVTVKAREGMTIVIHEMGFARDAATRVLFLDRGRAVETGSPERFLSNPETERARQFLQRHAGDIGNARR